MKRAANDDAPTSRVTIGAAYVPRDVPILAKPGTFATLTDACTKTVHRWVASGMPHVGSGRSLRIDVDAAIAWLREQSTDAPDDDETAGWRAAMREAGRRGR